jgi:hypothetical protein
MTTASASVWQANSSLSLIRRSRLSNEVSMVPHCDATIAVRCWLALMIGRQVDTLHKK